MSDARHQKMMKVALRLAARGDGRVYPNPSVGAVVYRGDRILGRGHTQPPGGAHAEIAALAQARKRHGERALRGASLAVTLEPCNFVGRTGACTEAILEAGIGRVIAGCRDPHPKVSGRGYQRLRRRGVEVTTGVLEDECRQQHRGFISVCERGRPWVTLKLATSLDGRIATASGESRWITGPSSREFVHGLRNRHDAIMVGSETAKADDPSLNVRRSGKVIHQPIRVLLDGRLRVPKSARLLSDEAASQTWVVCRERARGLPRLREQVGRVIEVRSKAGHVDLPTALRELAKAGLTTLLLEGGGDLAAAFLRSDLVDEVHWMLAPILLGGDGRRGLGPLELKRLSEAVSLEDVAWKRRGSDLHLHGLVHANARNDSTSNLRTKRSRTKREKGTRR